MGAITKISWCHSTWNPWIGCTPVADECANCYADALDKQRFSKTLGGGTVEHPIRHWGIGKPRHRTSEAIWTAPARWNKAPLVCGACGQESPKRWNHQPVECGETCWKCQDGTFEQRRVFCGSLMDWADHEVALSWRNELFYVADQCKDLIFLFLTKRAENAYHYLRARYGVDGPPRNFWFGLSWMHQRPEEIKWLLRIPAAVRFLSVEPMLGPFDLAAGYPWATGMFIPEIGRYERIHWAIFGGESVDRRQPKTAARPCNLRWIRDGVQLCREAAIAPYVKQLGSNPVQDLRHVIPESDCDDPSFDPADIAAWEAGRAASPIHLLDWAGADPAEWPADVCVQELPATV